MISNFAFVITLALLTVSTTVSEKFRFDNYKLIRLFPSNFDEVRFINELEEHDYNV